MSEDAQAVAAFVAAASKRVAEDVGAAVKGAAVSAFGEQLARLRVDVEQHLDPGAIQLAVHPVDLGPVAGQLGALAQAVGSLELSATMHADSTPVAAAVDALREAIAAQDGNGVVAESVSAAADAHGEAMSAATDKIVAAVNEARDAIVAAVNAASAAQVGALAKLTDATLRAKVVSVRRDERRDIAELRVAPEGTK